MAEVLEGPFEASIPHFHEGQYFKQNSIKDGWPLGSELFCPLKEYDKSLKNYENSLQRVNKWPQMEATNYAHWRYFHRAKRI